MKKYMWRKSEVKVVKHQNEPATTDLTPTFPPTSCFFAVSGSLHESKYSSAAHSVRKFFNAQYQRPDPHLTASMPHCAQLLVPISSPEPVSTAAVAAATNEKQIVL